MKHSKIGINSCLDFEQNPRVFPIEGKVWFVSQNGTEHGGLMGRSTALWEGRELESGLWSWVLED